MPLLKSVREGSGSRKLNIEQQHSCLHKWGGNSAFTHGSLRACCAQVPIFDLLKKFDGHHTSDDIKAGRRRFRLTKLPSYMVLHIKRFTKNNFFVEKNPTIVNFPVKNLELRDIVPVPAGKPAATP